MKSEKQMSKEVKKGQVFISPATGRKTVCKSKGDSYTFEMEVEIVADYPHEDEDFSYLCGSQYCRCMQ